MATRPTRRELGTRLAMLTALEKAVKAAKDEVRFQAEQMMGEAHREDGISSLDLLIGDEKVGKLSISKPTVGIAGGDQFAAWACERGMGRKVLTADVSDVPQDVLDQLNDVMDANHIARLYGYEADADAKRGLRVAGAHVVDGDGEVVPGTYVKRQGIRVTDCKPEDVGRAMSMLGDTATIAGLLMGGDE